jgi:hypothetical protein
MPYTDRLTPAFFKPAKRDDEIYRAADAIVENSEYYGKFDAVDSEIDGDLVKYFDEMGNCLEVNFQTSTIEYYPVTGETFNSALFG